MDVQLSATLIPNCWSVRSWLQKLCFSCEPCLVSNKLKIDQILGNMLLICSGEDSYHDRSLLVSVQFSLQPHSMHGNDCWGSKVIKGVKQEILNRVNPIMLFWLITKLFISFTRSIHFTQLEMSTLQFYFLESLFFEMKKTLMLNYHRNRQYIYKRKSHFIFLVQSVVCSSPVLSLGARKQSTQFNNRSGCLNQPGEALLTIYFSCIKLHLLFNFMAKWTSPISCPIPLLS